MNVLSRDFTAPWESRAVHDALQSLMVAELVSPSPILWLLSGWVSDVDVIDNRTGAFACVRPDWPTGRLKLSDFIAAFVDGGGRMAIVLRDVDHNAAFLARVEEIRKRSGGRLGLATAHSAHEKGIVGEEYIFAGSMNLTANGLGHSDEHVLLRVDRAAAAQRRLALGARWDGHLRWD